MTEAYKSLYITTSTMKVFNVSDTTSPFNVCIFKPTEPNDQFEITRDENILHMDKMYARRFVHFG